MALDYLENGNLTEGIHEFTWSQFVEEFGYTGHRMKLINGLKIALNALKVCNCQNVFIDGSFTTKKEKPGDWDGCFDTDGMDKNDIDRLSEKYPELWDYWPPRLAQKSRFRGEIFPISSKNRLMFEFFQKDRNGLSKGIIQLSLQNFVL